MKRITAIAVIASVLTCLVPAIAVLVEQLSGRFAEFRWTPLALAFALSLIYWPLNAYVWNLVLRALGHSLPGGTAVRIWLATQTCRWLPGGVWHYGSRTMHSIALGIPSTVAVASMALELLLTIAAWTVLVLVGMAVYGSRQLRMERLFAEQSIGLAMAGSLGLVLLIAIAYLSWRWFPQKYQAVRERFASLRLVRPRPVPTLICFLVYLMLSLLNGIAFYAVIFSVLPQAEVPFVAAASANALAWLVGLFAVMAPGGLVVREATLALQMGLWIPLADAVLIAVLWRLLQLAVELVCVAAAYAPQSLASRLPGRLRPPSATKRETRSGCRSPRLEPGVSSTSNERGVR